MTITFGTLHLRMLFIIVPYFEILCLFTFRYVTPENERNKILPETSKYIKNITIKSVIWFYN